MHSSKNGNQPGFFVTTQNTVYYWVHDNLEAIKAISTTSLTMFLLILGVKQISPLFTAFKDKVTKTFTEEPEQTVPFSEIVKHITTGVCKELTYSSNIFGSGVVHIKIISDARKKAYIVPGSEQSLFNLASIHVPSYKLSPESHMLWSFLTSSFLPLFTGLLVHNVTRSDLADDHACVMYRGLARSQDPLEYLKTIFNFGRATKQITKPEAPVEFDDVISNAKMELYDIVELLNDPECFFAYGATCPRGIIISGPPGVGKTMLAKAVAEKASICFIDCSASSFVNLYVGRGAKRVRQIFAEARRMAPAILFIDQLDALGHRREGEMSGPNPGWIGSEEYTQTLNQILYEMDGFKGRNDNILVIAATHQPHIIDPALLRSGRFDRWINMQLPCHSERLDIMGVSVKRRGVHLSHYAAQHLTLIAQKTSGWSGAELDALINEAAFATWRRNQLPTSSRREQFLTLQEDLDEAFERLNHLRAEKMCLIGPDDNL